MSTTRESIERAATRLFAANGFARTSVRAIAAESGVDPALVIRHFGSKEQLFLESMRLEFGLLPLDEGGLDGLGERLVGWLLDAEHDVRAVYLALVRASDAGEVGSRLRSAHDDDFVAPLRARLEGPDAELRARLVAALVGGLLYSLWIVRDEALAATPRAELVARYGALVQRLVTP